MHKHLNIIFSKPYNSLGWKSEVMALNVQQAQAQVQKFEVHIQ